MSSGKDEDASDTDSSVEDAKVADRLAESFLMNQASIMKQQQNEGATVEEIEEEPEVKQSEEKEEQSASEEDEGLTQEQKDQMRDDLQNIEKIEDKRDPYRRGIAHEKGQKTFAG